MSKSSDLDIIARLEKHIKHDMKPLTLADLKSSHLNGYCLNDDGRVVGLSLDY